MATTLAQILQRQLNEKQKVKSQPTTQAATGLLQAANTGKQLGSGPQVASTVQGLGEQQTQNALNAQGQQNQVAAQQMGVQQQGQVQEQQQTQLDLNQKAQQLSSSLSQKQDQLLQELEQGRASLGSEQMNAKMEQAASSIALQNQQYLQALQTANSYRRLDDDAKYKQELAASQWKEFEDLFTDSLAVEDLMKMDDREFAYRMGKLSIADAIRIADMSAQQQGLQGIMKGVTTAAGGFADYASNNSTVTNSSTATFGSEQGPISSTATVTSK